MNNNNNNLIGAQEAHKLILDWSSPNDNIRRPAEQAIEQFLNPSNNQINNFMQTLCQLLSNPQQTSRDVRIRIAILLRKRIATKPDKKTNKPMFNSLDINTRQKILETLIKQLSRDPDKDIRNQIADCLTELSTRTFTDLSNEYQNVQFIKHIFELYNLSDVQSTNNDELNVTNRINALQMFGNLCKWCNDDPIIKQNQKSIAQVYRVAFKQDKNRKVNIAALQAIQHTIKPLRREEVIGFIPLMFDVLKLLESTLNVEAGQVTKAKQQNNNYIIDDDDYQQTQYILEIIIDITCDQPCLFDDYNNNSSQSPLIPFVNAFNQLSTAQHLPPKVRTLALEFFLALAENDPSFARRKQIIAKSVINICLDYFLLEQIDDKQWDEIIYGQDEEFNDLSSSGEYGLDRLVLALTPDHVLPAIYNKLGIVKDKSVQQNGDNLYWKNRDWRKRHCAVTVITQISDHMEAESPQAQLASIKCLELFKDKNYRIQYAAINAIGQLSNDHFDLLSAQFTEQILLNLKSTLSVNNHIKIQTHSCAALINFVPHLEQQQIQNSLNDLLNGVMNVLQQANQSWQKANDATTKSNYQKAQEQALTAIAGLAEAAGDLFDQHYDLFAPILMTIIKSATNKEMMEIRCRAIECMGRFGVAVGGNKFSKHSHELMVGTISYFCGGEYKDNANIDIQGIEDDAFIETNIKVWPRILEAIGTQSFQTYLPTVCSILYNVSQISVISNRNPEIQNVDFDYDEFQENNDDPNIALIETQAGFIALDSQKMDNKMSALYCIDTLAESYGKNLSGFMLKAFGTLLDCIRCKYSLELRSEAAKLAPRYIEVVMAGISGNPSGDQSLKRMSEQLLNVFVNILDEGRKKSNNNGLIDEAGESGAIGVIAKGLLEFMNIIDPTQNEDYDPRQHSIIRSIVNQNKLEFIIGCMFECVIRAQKRIELFAVQETQENYDAIAREEFKEEKDFEDDLLFNIAMIIAEFIKIYKDDFIDILCKGNNMQQLLNFLNPQNANIRKPEFVHKTGVYVICDIYEQCSINKISKLLNSFIPQIFNIITNDQDPAVQQACFYCLGLMVDKCKNNVQTQYVQQILKLCTQCITRHSQNYINASIEIQDEETYAANGDNNDNINKKRQFLGVIDNAMSAICKIIKSNINNLDNKIRNESLNIWFKHLPIKSDCVEGQLCHEYLFQLVKSKNPIILGSNLNNLPFILKIYSIIRNTKLSTPDLNNIVGDFAKTICSQQPQFAKNLSIQERNNLGL